jgi:hypothetical protein
MAKTVALKVVYTLGRDPEVVLGRFTREVQALARLEHPNIVPIYHAGQWHGFPYFTMKLVPGGPLSHHLGRFHGNPAACARLVAKVARAVQALHDQKVIHRDLKPLNILLGDDDEPLVADFGLAKWTDEEPAMAGASAYPISGTGVPMGTRPYMAPEQTRAERTESPGAADIWALGVTLYELLAGSRPFPDDGRSDLAKRICEDPAPPLPDSVPAELAAVVGQCLAKRPGDRYPSAAAVADDLERWLGGVPVAASLILPAPPVAPLISPAPPVEPEVKPARHRPRLVAGVLLGLAALSAVMVAIFVGSPERPRSIPDRLQAGETVWLIRERDLPTHPAKQVPGSVATATLHARGYTSVTATDVGLVELCNEDLPWPVRLRAEYALTATRDDMSRAGVYVARKETPGTSGDWQSFAVLSHRSESLPRVFGLNWSRETFGFSFQWWRNPPGTTHSHPVKHRPVLVPTDPDEIEWRTVDIVIHPDRIDGSFAGIPVVGIDGPTVPGKKPSRSIEAELSYVRAGTPAGVAPFAPPYVGNGIGLYVLNAEAVFRNVTLERVDR